MAKGHADGHRQQDNHKQGDDGAQYRQLQHLVRILETLQCPAGKGRQGNNGNLGEEALELFRKAGLSAMILNVAGLLLGLVGGRLIGLSRDQAFTVAIELGIKNGTLGLMVTLTLLHSEAMSVPSAVYGVLMFVFGFLMIGFARLTGIGKGQVTP